MEDNNKFMGLDSVELLMEFENYFHIQIPAPEAEKIYTIQNMTDIVAKHLHVSENSTTLKMRIFHKIVDSLQKSSLANNEI